MKRTFELPEPCRAHFLVSPVFAKAIDVTVTPGLRNPRYNNTGE
jgi:hypothetical protein